MLDVLLGHLQAIGAAPRLVFDIGAHEGAFVDASRHFFPGAEVWAFEPNLAKRDRLAAKADRVFTDVLVEAEGDVTYWEAEFPDTSGNSLLRENTNIPFRATTRRGVPIDRLAEGRVPDLVKLDTQGSELQILRGGSASIAKAECAILEVSLKRYNQGSPLFAEVLAFMTGLDYRLIDMVDALRVGGILVQTNALFIKRSSPRYGEDVQVEFTLPTP